MLKIVCLSEDENLLMKWKVEKIPGIKWAMKENLMIKWEMEESIVTDWDDLVMEWEMENLK